VPIAITRRGRFLAVGVVGGGIADYVSQNEASGEDDDLAERLAHVTMAGVFRIPDEMWVRIQPLIPVPEKVHRFGGGRPRIPDRQVLDGIFFVLRTGCQWRALDATEICDGSTAHRRFQEWQRAGFFDALWQQALCDYDAEVGIDWTWLSIDGAMGKARWEAARRGATPPIAASLGPSAA
jgi:transposase